MRQKKMAIGRVMHKNVVLFPDFNNVEYGKYDEFWEMQLFLQIPNLTKADILEYFEYLALERILSGECDVGFVPMSYLDSKNEIMENDPNPTYISEYINIVGQLFLAGYIDFGLYCDDDEEEILLSKQKPDKYQSWIHFRDNFFYANRFCRELDEPEIKDSEGNCLLIGFASWDNPKYWSQYNILTARTPKGTKYFNKILSPKFYNKYKDLEVEIDDKGNIIKWIGKINK